jgi:hypothetical protein
VLLAACGGSGGSSSGAQTLDELASAHGTQIGLTNGNSDFAPGPVRYSFLIIDKHGEPIERPSARVWIADDRKAVPFVRTTASLEPIEVPGNDGDHHVDADAKSLYVVHADIDKPGTFWVLARPDGGSDISGLGTFTVKAKSESPALGTKAPVSETPTLGSAPIAMLTTRRPPDRDLLRYSVADSLRKHLPFVVTFATPAFCSSRVCGPVVDIVDTVRKRLGDRGIRFIHVEIYKDNKPNKGLNRWVRQWTLPSEPWTFVVGADGRIKQKFEGALSAAELERAVRQSLLR